MSMIDLHSHILPGLDDGAPDMDAALAMARTAVAEGIRTVVATPHVNFSFDFELDEIGKLVGQVNIALARAEIALAVLPGAEIALARLAELSDEQLRGLCLGPGSSVLVESPYARSVGFLDDLVFSLQVRGFRPVLAHPERCPSFRDDVTRLRGLVERGTLCTVNAGSIAGAFGMKVQRFALELFREGLVHAVASDCHDDEGRPPRVTIGFDRAEAELPGIKAQQDWFTRLAPSAILSGDPLPERPAPPAARPSVLRRLLPRA